MRQGRSPKQPVSVSAYLAAAFHWYLDNSLHSATWIPPQAMNQWHKQDAHNTEAIQSSRLRLAYIYASFKRYRISSPQFYNHLHTRSLKSDKTTIRLEKGQYHTCLQERLQTATSQILACFSLTCFCCKLMEYKPYELPPRRYHHPQPTWLQTWSALWDNMLSSCRRSIKAPSSVK